MDENKGLTVKPWRKAYEIQSFAAWASALAYQTTLPLSGFQTLPGLFAAVLCGTMALKAGADCVSVWNRRLMLFRTNVLKMPLSEIEARFDAQPEMLYLGEGWEWTPDHTQWVYDLQRMDVDKIAPPRWFMAGANVFTSAQYFVETELEQRRREQKTLQRFKRTGKAADKKQNIYRGLRWIHGLTESKPLYIPLEDLKGNTLITGTTRSGKTVLYRMLCAQMIRRGECLIIIDPKGDADLRDIVLELAKKAGRLDDVVYFNPSFSESSVRLDPLASYEQASQLASRIEPLIPSKDGGDPFSKFSWGVIESLFSGMDMIGLRPSLKNLRVVIERGPDQLLLECVLQHAKNLGEPDIESSIAEYADLARRQIKGATESMARVHGAATYYKEILADKKDTTAISGLLQFWEHNREHASKMLASLMPVLKSLTSGTLEALMSPDPNDASDKRPIFSFEDIITQRKIALIGLDSMSDGELARGIGSIYLSDLVANAATRYNHDASGSHTINLLVDEQSNALNKQFMELLNKGAGAGFRIMSATQTVPDYEDALGSTSSKDKAIGNYNNTISLRVIDDATQEYVSGRMGEVSVRTTQVSQNITSLGTGHNPLLFSGNYGGRTTDTPAPTISKDLLSRLPDLEFVAQISAGRIIKGRMVIMEAEDGNGTKTTLSDIPWVRNMLEGK